MATVDQVIKHRTAMFQESIDLISKKGHDYNRQQQDGGDTLFNLRVAALLGIVPTPERGILVRLSDKFMRLISLMSPGVEASVKGESVRDTVRDIHNYIDYALLMWEEAQKPMAAAGNEQLRQDFPIKSYGLCVRCGTLHGEGQCLAPRPAKDLNPTTRPEPASGMSQAPYTVPRSSLSRMAQEGCTCMSCVEERRLASEAERV